MWRYAAWFGSLFEITFEIQRRCGGQNGEISTCLRLGSGAMAEGEGNRSHEGTAPSGSESGNVDDRKEMIRLGNVMTQHISATQLSHLDLTTPGGLASLSAILGQALQTSLVAGEIMRAEESRTSTQQRDCEKRKNKEERAKA